VRGEGARKGGLGIVCSSSRRLGSQWRGAGILSQEEEGTEVRACDREMKSR
jgi:hypothetical protein